MGANFLLHDGGIVNAWHPPCTEVGQIRIEPTPQPIAGALREGRGSDIAADGVRTHHKRASDAVERHALCL